MRLAPLLLLLASSAAFAGGNNELTIGSRARALNTPSANAVTADGLFSGDLQIAHRIDLGLLPKLETWAVGRFDWGSADGTMFSTLTTEIDTLSFTAGGRALYRLHSHVAVGARLDFGTQRAALKITEGSRELNDHGWGGTASAALSLDLLAYSSNAFKIGLRGELGYTKTSAIALAPSEANDPDTIQLQMSQASLGKLDTSGKFFGFSVLSEF